MKPNEAPEKLYIDFRDRAESTWRCAYTEKALANDIEYIRKDAFIEKAVEWIKEHKEAVETEDNGIMGWIPDYFIEDFKNYMRGE